MEIGQICPALLAFVAISMSLFAGPVLLASFLSPTLTIAPTLPVLSPVGLFFSKFLSFEKKSNSAMSLPSLLCVFIANLKKIR